MKRKYLLSGLGVASSVLLVAAPAFGCTAWRGKMTVTGSGSSPGSVSAMGSTLSMDYCSTGAPSGTAGMAANTSGTVTVTIAAATSGCNSSTLPDNTYTIRWTTGVWSADDASTNDCMSTTSAGTMSVTSGAGGPTTSNSFNPGAAGTIQVCAADSTAAYGIQVPLTVA